MDVRSIIDWISAQKAAGGFETGATSETTRRPRGSSETVLVPRCRQHLLKLVQIINSRPFQNRSSGRWSTCHKESKQGYES